jgi:uncharacterized protein YndB with AHSA1/START domain
MATKTLHERSVHIDAPVERVFDYMQDPHHFLAAFPEKDRSSMAITEVNLTPDGVGSTFTMIGKMFLFHVTWVLTREEYIPNRRIVDHASLGGVWTSTFEPDETGTTLSLAFGWSSRVPLVGQVADRIGWEGDADLDIMLANVKEAIET